jgi:hypothetical protein
MNAPGAIAPAVESISLSIASLRAHRVILDADLATLYEVPTKRFNEAVKRNAARFPADFMFRPTAENASSLRSQSATLKTGRGQHRKCLPYAFTEHRAIMAAMVVEGWASANRNHLAAQIRRHILQQCDGDAAVGFGVVVR